MHLFANTCCSVILKFNWAQFSIWVLNLYKWRYNSMMTKNCIIPIKIEKKIIIKKERDEKERKEGEIRIRIFICSV